MQFKRVKGGTTQIHVYQGYDKVKKRAIVKMVGSLNYDMQPSDGLIDSLTDDQKIELQAHINEVLQSRKKSSLQWSIDYLDSRIVEVSDSISSGNFTVTQEKADSIYEAVEKLQKAMKKAGFKKAAKKSSLVVADPRQVSIIPDSQIDDLDAVLKKSD